MSVSGIGSNLVTMQAIGQMRDQLEDLQRQLGSGIKSTTYAGLGLDAGLTVGLRSQLNSVSGYQSTITQVGVRLDLMQTALSQLNSTSQQTQGTILQSQYVLAGGNQTQDQKNTATTLDAVVGMLNTSSDGRYLFSGSTVDQQPVDSVDHILSGDGVKAVLTQVIAERKLADLGANGLGRLNLGNPSSTSVSLTEDSISPFGFKLVGISTAMAGAAASPPSGSPQTMSIDFGSAAPVEGDTVTLTFTLPDGTTRNLTLTATNASPPGDGQFTIGATPQDTATNFQGALTQSLGKLANPELVAASAVAAGNDFFNTDASHPPQRVDGPPFESATQLIDGTATTVAWYQGDNATTDPRQTSLALADQSLTVAYGARANEQGLRTIVQSLAVFAATQFSSSDPNGQGAYAALRQRLGGALNGGPNQQQASDIASDLAGAQVALQNASDRHDQTNTTLQNVLQSVQGAPQEQVAAQILTLQTSLQATLQTTAMLLKTSILNYL